MSHIFLDTARLLLHSYESQETESYQPFHSSYFRVSTIPHDHDQHCKQLVLVPDHH